MIYLLQDVFKFVLKLSLALIGLVAAIALGVMIPWLGLIMIVGLCGALIEKLNN